MDIAKQYVVEEHVTTSQSASPRVEELGDADEGGECDVMRSAEASTTAVAKVSVGVEAMAISDSDCVSTAQETKATFPTVASSDAVAALAPSLNALTIDTTAALTPTPAAADTRAQEQERQRLVLESKRLFKQQMTAPRPPPPIASITTLWDGLLPSNTTTTTTTDTYPHSPTPENTSPVKVPLGQETSTPTPTYTANKRPETFFWSEELDLRLADYIHKYDLNYDKISRKLQLMYKLQLLNDDQRKMLYSIMYTNGIYDSMNSESNSHSRFPLSPSSFDAASADSDALEAAITQLTSTTTTDNNNNNNNNGDNNNVAIHTAALFLSADACRIRWYQLNPHLWSSSSTSTLDDNNSTDPATITYITNTSHTTHLIFASTKPNFSIFAKPDKTNKGQNDRNSAPNKVKTFDMLLQQSNNNDEDEEEEDDEGDEAPAHTTNTNQPQHQHRSTPSKSSPSLPAYLTRPVALPSMSDDDDSDTDESTAISHEANSRANNDNNSDTDNGSGDMDQEDDEEDAFPTPSQDGGSDSDKAMSADSDALLYTLD